jgi:hypothetical protein
MPAAQRVLSVWSDLLAAGGAYQGTLRGVTKWITTLRSDGEHRMQLTVPNRTPGTDVLGDFATPALVPPGAPAPVEGNGPPTAGSPYVFWDDITNTTGLAVDLTAYTPTPGGGGVTGYEYRGGATEYKVEDWDQIRNNTTTPSWGAFRTNADLYDDNFEVVADLGRLSSDQNVASSVFTHLKNTTIASFLDNECYAVRMYSTGASTIKIQVEDRRTSTTNLLHETSDITLYTFGAGSPSALRLRVRVVGLTMTVWRSDVVTGANEVLVCEVTLPVDYRDGNHRRIGFASSGNNSGVIALQQWGVRGPGSDPGLTDPTSWVEVIGDGKVLLVEREDASMEEWVVGAVDRDYDRDVMEVTALPVAAWFTERVRLRDGNNYSATFTGSLEDALDHLLTLGNWPPWLIPGTVEVNPTLTVTYGRDSGPSGLGKLVAAANATTAIRLARQTIRSRWRRVNAMQWAIDLLVSPASGTPAIVEGKNLTKFRDSNDRTRAAQVIYPLNDEDTGIAEAHFRVTAVDLGDELVTLGDWSRGPADLAIVEDGQWVGKYLREPDGTLHLITDSFAATRQLEVTGIVSGDFEVNDIVRIVESDGSSIYAVALPNRLNPKADDDVRPFAAATNWAPNAHFRDIDAGTGIPDGYTASDGAEDDLSIETDPQYIETGTQSLRWDAAGADELLTADLMRQPNDRITNGSTNVTIHWGVVYWGGASPLLTALPLITGTFSGTEYLTNVNEEASGRRVNYGTMRLNFSNGNTGFRVRLKSLGAGTIRIDRVWAFIEGQETDTTVEGCGPLIGLFEGNRTLLDRAQGGLAYEVGVHDVYRERPTVYPGDRLEVDQIARLVVPSRGVDVEIPIAELVVDELHRHRTGVVVGAIRRKLTTLV